MIKGESSVQFKNMQLFDFLTDPKKYQKVRLPNTTLREARPMEKGGEKGSFDRKYDICHVFS